MKVEEKGHTFIIKDTQGNCNAFLMKVTHEHKSFENHNLILDISQDKNTTPKSISQFLPLSKTHRKRKKSFVIVASGIDFNAVPTSLLVVPTLLEAHDIIEMEEIERDLGF
ncbi:MAG TPA: hypothetical protein VK623_02450 [Flavobacterium sp.]|nr:hypothetical protein [Flavobacterium sp.]